MPAPPPRFPPQPWHNTRGRSFPHFPRATAPARPHHPHLAHTTTIIIAVVASFAGLVFVLILWRTLSRCSSRRRAVPLPPVQPLAHQREHQLAAFNAEGKPDSRPQTWYSDQPTVSYRHSSKASLLPHLHSGPSREPSTRTQETLDTAESPSAPLALNPPNPAFGAVSPPSASSSSLSSSAEHASPSTPGTGALLSPSASSASTHTRARTRSASRPFSMLSTSTSGTARSRTPIRGAPHGPHSNVQIVLPAPLAPELYPYMLPADAQGRPLSVFAGGSPQRASWGGGMTDKWVSIESFPTEVPVQQRRSTSTSRESQRMSRDTRSSSSFSQRRSNSNPPPASRLRQSSTPNLTTHSDSLPLPPVPPIPSAYGPPADMSQQHPVPAMQSPPSSFPSALYQQSAAPPQRLRKPRSTSAVAQRRHSGGFAS
ncbi:hypothetical protein FA95DRAFT_1558058 [Auriscalpium vulgare]|uniref:Uncharacterized protein n=1 Tax=Auriscalpium vulgare TaxID=40419 RepID=A0ACB8RWY6_9AGAM|nr:hypothetical protein FA95DRAFT_1558058 [Auriscalpium vulgare]